MMLNRLALVGFGLVTITFPTAVTLNAEDGFSPTRQPGKAISIEDPESRSAEVPATASRPRPLTPKEQFDTLREERDAAKKVFDGEKKKAKTEVEMRALIERFRPVINDTDYAGRLLAVAEAHRDDPATGDALLWIVSQGVSRPEGIGPWAKAYARAVELLVAHHADGPLVAGTALLLQDGFSPERDRLIRGLQENAKGRAARGTATLALAQYLESKANFIPELRKRSARMPIWTDEFEKQMRASDPEALKAEAERLLEQVVAKFGDVPYVRGREPLTEHDLARKWTLGRVAEARLDEMHNLAVGKPAPDIEGGDLNGKPMRLSDYRGKVIVLVFWGSWCGPCMAEVPHERELFERLKGRPFVLLGVDCEEDKEKARAVVVREQMTWPSWYDGAPGEGPIAGRYHIRDYPSTFVLDANGLIRHKNVRGEGLGRAVDEILGELARPNLGPGTPSPGSEKNASPEL